MANTQSGQQPTTAIALETPEQQASKKTEAKKKKADAKKEKNEEKAAAEGIAGKVKNWAALVVGVGAIILYVVWTYKLREQVGLPDTNWQRMLFLYNGIQAIAFGGAGYLFGEKVNRERAEKAEDKAEEEESEAKEQTAKVAAAKTNLVGLRDGIAIAREAHRKGGARRAIEDLSQYLGGAQMGVQLNELRQVTKDASRDESVDFGTSDWDQVLAAADMAVKRIDGI